MARPGALGDFSGRAVSSEPPSGDSQGREIPSSVDFSEAPGHEDCGQPLPERWKTRPMSTYNQANIQLECPRCGAMSVCEVDLYFGYTGEMKTVSLGEPYPFLHRRQPQNGGPLPPDAPWGDAYTECGACDKDFFCIAVLNGQILQSVEPDLEEPPYGPDHQHEGILACFECGSLETRFQTSRGYSVGRLICDAEGCKAPFVLVKHDTDLKPIEIPYQKQRPTFRNR